jgi:glycosyltransferase involved in cell wall biosynthesis
MRSFRRGGGAPEVSLPRLLYVGDVPVESTIAGAAVLYRLFDGYPTERIVICQSDLAAVRSPARRLAGVQYHEFPLGATRLLHSRLSGYYSAFMLARAAVRRTALTARLAGVSDAIVTIAHGYSWLTAARLARIYGVPLHLIVHDDCLMTVNVAPPLRAFAESRFSHVYRTAANRFCISAAMCDHYFRLYGVPGEVLYPSRARDARVNTSPSSRAAPQGSPFTVAFAGSLNVGHIPAAEALAKALAPLGGRLEIYGPDPAPDVRSRLTSPAVSFHAYLPSNELAERLRERADLLLMPMSFDAADARNMELCFPSKLADYTAMGVPILIVGPSYCSAVRWARENAGVAEVVTGIGPGELSSALTKLHGDAALRRRLAAEALRVGLTFFGHQQAQDHFIAAISQPPSSTASRA